MSSPPYADILYTDDTNLVAFVGFTVLIWDHILTFVDEVELIWMGNKGLLVYLFLVNRYLTPLGFIINIVAFMLPSWGTETCQEFVRYEGAMTTIGIQVAGLMMFLRVRAIYNKKKAVVWSVMLLFLVWVGVNAWLLTYGQAVQHASGRHSCSMVFDVPFQRKVASISAWMPALYDTFIFALTLSKTIPALRKEEAGHIVRTLHADGIQYYVLMCAVNVVLGIMIASAPEGLQNITAQLELLLTVAMMSRITINLKKQALYGPTLTGTPTDTITYPTSRSRAGSLSLHAYRPNSLVFSHNPALYREQKRLSTVFSVNVTSRAVSPAIA